MRRLALLISIVAWTAGCGDQPPPQAAAQRPETAVLPCSAGWTYPDRYFKGDWREHAVTAGPITLLWLNSRGDDDFRRRTGLHTKVLLAPHRTVTVAVAAADRERVSMTPQMFNTREVYAEGDPAITFEGCPPRTDDSRRGEELGTGFAFTLLVERPGCATFEITPEGAATMRRRVRFGVERC